MNIYAVLKESLREAGVERPDLEARFILQHYTKLTDVDIIAGVETFIDDNTRASIFAAVARRATQEPLSRILGSREFWGLEFMLSPATLDPRPDSETLIEAALLWQKTEKRVPTRILDLGTGTGCLLLTLLHEWKAASGLGVDLAPEACATASRNAENLGLKDRATFINGSWFDPVTGLFDVIVSNPPYIPSTEIPNLDSNVRNHDPILALDGGDDGLEPYKILFPALKNYLAPGGAAFFEIGIHQLPDIERLVRSSGATLSRVYQDLGGIPRVVKITLGDK